MHLIALALAATPAALAATITTAAAYASSSDSVYALSEYDAPVQGTGDAGSYSKWSLSVDDTSSGYKQTVRGFGAAVTDATVAVFNDLPSDQFTQLLSELMTSDGANFAVLRHTIASSDLSADPAYSYDDNNNSNNADTSLSSFNLGDRGTAMATLLAKMQTLQPDLTLLGSVWSPPGWMKKNGVIDGTTVDNNLNHSYVDAYAQYFVSYIQKYAALGATVNAITIQNEPLNSKAGFPTMYVFADESGLLINENVGPALAAADLGVDIWAYDHNTDQPSYPQTVLNEASTYVKTVAWHCYASDNDWTVMTAFHSNNSNVEQIMTECWTSPSTSWRQAADFAMGPLQNWGTGALAWNLGSNTSYGPYLSGSGACTTCRGLVVVDVSAGTYLFAIDYYMLAQFSKFIPKGAIVLNGTGSYSYSDGTGIESVATVNPDGSRTVVIENKFANDVYVTLSTSSGETWSGLVYTESVTTWLLPAAF